MAAHRENKIRLVEIIPLLLGTFGLVMVFSASSGISVYKRTIPVSFIKQLAIFIVAVSIFFISSKLKPKIWEKMSPVLIMIAISLLILTRFFGQEINYARRWLYIGKISFQPSIFAQLALITFLAKKRDFGISVLFISLIAGLILIQPDISMALMTVLLGIMMLFLNETKIWKVVGVAGIMLLIGGAFIAKEGYAHQRITTYLNPNSISKTVQAISNGGFSGLGLGSGMGKFFYIPFPDSDFIFSIIGEELGFIGSLFVISLFLIYFISASKSSLRASNNYASILGLGLISFIAIYALVHILVSLGVIPVTGVPLPFISRGGTALVIAYIAGGVIVSIEKDHSSIRRWNGGTYIPGSFHS
ncbi:MAG: FtsW/RodA/SpoVE family cell cycle protein [candidate division WOR-3 bacterium]|nr:FtsW/RodA/SpoVE family cell cycle protein [candidate division WOR-3 bacterium]